MVHRTRAAAVLLVPVVVLGLAACGGSSAPATQSTVPAKVQARHWRTGLVHWHASTQHALDGLSMIFSTEASLVALGRGTSRSARSLESYEGVLVRCSKTIRRLGPVPPGLEVASRYALLACQNLEKGEKGVETLVHKLRRGQGFDTLDPLTGAGSQLSMGQAQLNTVMHALKGLPE